MLIFGFVSQTAQAGDDEWTTTSLAGFGVNDITAEPTNPNVLYAATNRGLLLSWDGGHTWRALPLGEGAVQVAAVLVHPEEARQLYAAFGGKLQKSVDGGQTWQKLGEGVVESPYWIGMPPGQPDVVYVMTGAGLFRSRDGGGSWSSAGIPVSSQVQGLAFHPDDPNVIFVAANNGRSLFRTSDGGQSWTEIPNQLNNASALAMTPDGKLFLQDRNGVQRSDDNGQSWQQVNPEGVRYFAERTLAVEGNEPNTIYIGVDEGIYRSDDEGALWTAFTESLPGWPQKIIADPTTDGRLFAVVDNQLFTSTDGGESWRGYIATVSYNALQAHPAQPNTLFARSSNGYRGNLWRSQDGGQTWQISNKGLEEVAITTLAFDLTGTNMIYAGTDAGLYRSRDGGIVWEMTGLPNNVHVLSVVVDPLNSANLFVGGSNDLLRSTNSGESWTAASLGQNVSSLAIDSKNPQNMYALVNGKPYRSIDSGATWASLNYPGRNAVSLAIKPDDGSVLYVSGYDGLYVSHDGGSNLTTLAFQPAELRGDYTLPILQTDPKRPNALYLAMGPALYLSPDTGVNWYPLKKGAPAFWISSIAVDAGDPLTLYAVHDNGEGGVWQYRLSQLPEPPTPTPTASATVSPTPFPTVTPRTQALETTVSGGGRLSATATALAASREEIDATAVAVLGLDEEVSTPENDPQTDTPEAVGPTSSPNWFLLAGGMLLFLAVAGGGFYWWQQRQETTVVMPPSLIVCSNCGAELPSQAKFCIKCGQPQ